MKKLAYNALKRWALAAVAAMTAAGALRAAAPEVRFHNEAADTARINTLLIDAAERLGQARPEARVAYFARTFLDTPYAAATLEGSPEMLTVNLDQLDCTTLIDNVAALAYTLGEGRTSWRDFVYNLKRLRYAGGEVDGYASRLHYVSAWILDNTHRGNLREATSSFPEADYAVKTLDFISANRDKYPALADSAAFEGIRNLETGYRNHRFPYIKASKAAAKSVAAQLREGDIVAITTKTPGLDVQHMAIVVLDDNLTPHLLHASSAAGKVVVEKGTLADYFRKNRTASGMRIIRLCE